MLYQIIGVKRASFTDKTSGKEVNFAKLHVIEDGVVGVVGQSVDVLKIPYDEAKSYEGLIGFKVDVQFGKTGSIIGCKKV